MVVLLGYASATFSVSWSDRFTRLRLIEWMLRGPVTASATLWVVTMINRSSDHLGLDIAGVNTLATVVSIIMLEYLITVLMPYIERGGIVGLGREDYAIYKEFQGMMVFKPELVTYLEALTGDKHVDVVISGINHGANLATDIIYSGTVGAAMEGYFHDVPSFALSLDVDSQLTYDEVAAVFARDLPKFLADTEKTFLYNINFPHFFKDGVPQYVFGRQGRRDYLNAFVQEVRDGKTYYTMGGDIYDSDKGNATDIFAMEQGYISVTPLVTDMTDYMEMDKRLEK